MSGENPVPPDPHEKLPFLESLLARGLPSPLAARVAAQFDGWSALATAGKARLQELFTPAEITAIAAARKRRAIPAATVRRLLAECDSRCCICWNIDRDTGVVIHHLTPHSVEPDDRYENLVALCPNHHAAVHTVHELDRHPYPTDLLRSRKLQFAAALADFKAGRRPAPGRERESQLGRFPGAPPPPAHFLGRADSTAAAVAHLGRGLRRVALIGMGGAGKTALALNVLDGMRKNFPGGICWFEAEPGRSPIAPLLLSLLSALGGAETDLDVEGRTALVQALLRERTTAAGDLLLALDNISESGLPELVRLVDGLPDKVALLVTARETTVAAALTAAPVPVGPLARNEARVLLERISDAPQALADAGAGDRLLDLLGDLPLAVELVARQLAIRAAKPGFSLAVLCRQLEHFNSALLSFPGHRGIAMSFALSYDSLEPDARALFRLLGEFAEGPLRLPDVAGVAEVPLAAAEALLDRLVVISMLHWGEGPGDYRAHPLLHKYAAFLLEQSDQEERTRTAGRFRRHFVAVLEAAAASRQRDPAAIDGIFGNLAKAIRDAAAAGESAVVSDSMMSLVLRMDYFQRRNLELESVPLVELAIVSAETLGDQDRVAAHVGHLGNAWSRLGDLDMARRCYERAAAIVRHTGNTEDLASNLQNIAQSMLSDGDDPERIEQAFLSALDAAQCSENLDALFGVFSGMGTFRRQAGRLREAAGFHEAAIGVARKAGNRRQEGNALSNLGLVMKDLGDDANAERLITEALALARETGDSRGEGNRMGHLGGIFFHRALALRDGTERIRLISEARDLMAAAVRLAGRTRDPEKLAMWTMNLGNTHRATGDTARAEALFEEALNISKENGHALVEAQVRFNLGLLCIEKGTLHDALHHLETARSVFEEAGMPAAHWAAKEIDRVRSRLSRRT